MPLPSQSPVTGHVAGSAEGDLSVVNGVPIGSVWSSVNVAVAGSKTPRSVTPLPSQSPVTGQVVGVAERDLGDGAVAARSRNLAVPGRRTPTSQVPTPSQLPAIGRSPCLPNLTVGPCALHPQLKTRLAGSRTPGLTRPLPSQSPSDRLSRRSPILMTRSPLPRSG